MCETCKDGIYPKNWSDVEGKSGIISMACPDCGKLFWGYVTPPKESAQHSVHWTLRLLVWLKNNLGLGLRQ